MLGRRVTIEPSIREECIERPIKPSIAPTGFYDRAH
jgi:hypothetical protein